MNTTWYFCLDYGVDRSHWLSVSCERWINARDWAVRLLGDNQGLVCSVHHPGAQKREGDGGLVKREKIQEYEIRQMGNPMRSDIGLYYEVRQKNKSGKWEQWERM